MYLSGGVCECVCVCVCVCCLSSLVCMVGVVFVYVDTVYGILWVFFFILRMFQHDYLDTYWFECLIYMHFVFLYLHLFSTVEHVSYGKAL